MNITEDGYFSGEFQREIKNRFFYVDEDCFGRERLFFENSGGSLRLKEAVRKRAELDAVAECPERVNDIAVKLKKVKEQGIRDIMEIIFGADAGHGALVTELTASQCMFQIVRTIAENARPGGNAVTTSLEHPSAYDSLEQYCAKTGRELRTAPADPSTGGTKAEDILSLVDRDTVILSVMSASNISGYVFDLETVCREARRINPDIYIISDAVQHVPHGIMDVSALGLDGCTFAPYKIFGVRGCGYGYVSDRVASMEHHRLSAKPENEWELGTFPHPNFASISAVADYVCWIGGQFSPSLSRKTLFREGMERIRAQERLLRRRMLDGEGSLPGLRHIPGVKVFFDREDGSERDLICAIGIEGMDHSEAAKEFCRRGVTVFERVNTSLYSKRILDSLGTDGCIRVSPLHCHGPEDIDRFLETVSKIARERV